MSHTCNPTVLEVEAGMSEVQDFPELPMQFKGSLGYTRPCLKTKGNSKVETQLCGCQGKIFIVVIKHYDQGNWGRKEFIPLTLPYHSIS